MLALDLPACLRHGHQNRRLLRWHSPFPRLPTSDQALASQQVAASQQLVVQEKRPHQPRHQRSNGGQQRGLLHQNWSGRERHHRWEDLPEVGVDLAVDLVVVDVDRWAPSIPCPDERINRRRRRSVCPAAALVVSAAVEVAVAAVTAVAMAAMTAIGKHSKFRLERSGLGWDAAAHRRRQPVGKGKGKWGGRRCLGRSRTRWLRLETAAGSVPNRPTSCPRLQPAAAKSKAVAAAAVAAAAAVLMLVEPTAL